MKTSKPQKSTASSTHSSELFFPKTTADNAARQNEETEKPFFEASSPGTDAEVMKKEEGDNSAPTPLAQAEREREVKAMKVGNKNYVLYQKVVHVGGSSSWLANNPGNLDLTEDTEAWGAYKGKFLKWGAHKFAIFPTIAQGFYALKLFLRKHQIHPVSKNPRSILTMMWLFAPESDGNDPEGYANTIAKALGVPISALIKDLSNEQMNTFTKAMQKVEGWKPGKVFDRDDSINLPKKVLDVD